MTDSFFLNNLRGQGGYGKGQGNNQPSGGRGRMGGSGLGSGGNCVCPSCGKKVAHKRGMPCVSMKCPDCGTFMTRER